tara:strand:- start:190 stop:1491 length:1302 start_codon:yes stop_codon:yes gene_type:complete
MLKEKKPIFALSTPLGKSALAVFRLSGNNSQKIIKKISSNKKWKTHKPELNQILDHQKKIIDQTITTFFKTPNSYTGENMVEISCHGSISVINKITETLLKAGVFQAKPGEFTKRALDNDKFDITQVEALSDLINAETEKQRILALRNLDGYLSDFSKKITNSLMKMLADTEALIDFSDEDLPKNIIKKIKEQNENIIKHIKTNLKRSKISKSIRSGFLVSIIGKPNTGKSSFVNYISGSDIAIVTNIPGTTTDSLEVPIDVDGYKIRFVDTAGIRKHKNVIEKMGIEKAKKTSLVSDLNIVFLERSEKKQYIDIPNKIFVKSKYDISKKRTLMKNVINISSKTGYGVDRLLKNTKKRLINENIEKTNIFSRERQINKMKNCLSFLESVDFRNTPDIIAEDIRSAIKENEEIYQKFDIEKILDIIFSDFCIGK